jgi:hypothetical protein
MLRIVNCAISILKCLLPFDKQKKNRFSTKPFNLNLICIKNFKCYKNNVKDICCISSKSNDGQSYLRF